jgi:hypothetical protein
MDEFKYQIKINANDEKEARETLTALLEMLSTLKPKGVIKMMDLYKKDFTIRTVVNSKLGVK